MNNGQTGDLVGLLSGLDDNEGHRMHRVYCFSDVTGKSEDDR